MLTITAPPWAALAFGERAGVAMPRTHERDAAALEQPQRTRAGHADPLGLSRKRAGPSERPCAQASGEAGLQRMRGLAGLSFGAQTSAQTAAGVHAKHISWRAEAAR